MIGRLSEAITRSAALVCNKFLRNLSDFHFNLKKIVTA